MQIILKEIHYLGGVMTSLQLRWVIKAMVSAVDKKLIQLLKYLSLPKVLRTPGTSCSWHVLETVGQTTLPTNVIVESLLTQLVTQNKYIFLLLLQIVRNFPKRETHRNKGITQFSNFGKPDRHLWILDYPLN